jgi:hypothetical protein
LCDDTLHADARNNHARIWLCGGSAERCREFQGGRDDGDEIVVPLDEAPDEAKSRAECFSAAPQPSLRSVSLSKLCPLEFVSRVRKVIPWCFCSKTHISLFSRINAQCFGTGVTDTEIKLGQTSPFSGAASAYSVIAKRRRPISG